MLKDKTVLVTGAAKGIGRAIALAFAQKGANIVLNYRSSVEDSLIEEIRGFGVQCLPIKADVSSFEEAQRLIKEAKDAFGTIDVVVNNAGITRDMLLLRMSEKDFDSVIDTNLKGTFNVIRHVSGIMLKQKSGAIINMASVVALIGNIGQANYVASKAGIIGLTKATAKELGSRGVTCNAIAPGFIETDMTASLKDEAKKTMVEMTAVKRFGTVEDVASAAVFLAENTYITGQVLNVDGGMVMS